MRWQSFLFACLIAYGAFQHYQTREVKHGIGELASVSPMQVAAEDAGVQYLHDYKVSPLTTFSIKARVLGVKSYYFGREAELSPVDFALGWGQMSDEAVLSQVQISQSNRFYFWRVNEFPIPRSAIETQSANMHMIPANDLIKARLKTVRVGQLVQIDGYLVEVTAEDGWRWRSSLTREDTGNGACELVLVKSIQVF
ncbi:MAG: hypothetical protein PHD12_08815 [Methylotenera sp.]|nr:hypothetical protein [Methylotenera sp.]